MLHKKLTDLIKAISARRTFVAGKFKQTGVPIIDAFHGEMHAQMDTGVQQKLLAAIPQLISESADLSESDGRLYHKSRPLILRQLAAQKLFSRLACAGIPVSADAVIVSPYSSLVMLEAAIATIARPGGLILCPEGFYKSNGLHIEKYGLALCRFPADLQRDGRINATCLRAAIEQHQASLCGILLTLPGNPLVAEYTLTELEAIARVLIEANVRVIIDATFDQIQPQHVPLAAIQLNLAGQQKRLYDQTVTISGISKGHHASGPFKIGAATSGDSHWLQDMQAQLTISFQRETTALARIVLEETTENYLEQNRQVMIRRQQEAKCHMARINQKLGAGAVCCLGSAQYGPFILLTLRSDILAQAGVTDGWQLADMLLAAVGIKSVAGPLMGLSLPAVRINIDAPRITWQKDPALLSVLFERIEHLAEAMLQQRLTYQKALTQLAISTTVSTTQFSGDSDGTC
ncbi:MAG: aminotransferase class I/II-fold pyridoxal phosphate-dependent enzyme [Pseudomonadota bacterium]